jgi:cell division protein FtsQ
VIRRWARFVLLRVLPLTVLAAFARVGWTEGVNALRESPSFTVTKVMVRGHRHLTPRELADVAGIHPGDPLLDLDLAGARDRLALHPRVGRASVDYVFPRGVRLTVEERRAVALLDVDGLRGVTADGVVLPPVPGRPPEDLPVVVPPARVVPEGQVITDPRVREALAFCGAFEAVSPVLVGVVSTIDLTARAGARVYLDTLDVALVYAPGDPERWREGLVALPAVIEDLAREGVQGAVLDLRFRDQIVRRGGDGLASIEPRGTR